MPHDPATITAPSPAVRRSHLRARRGGVLVESALVLPLVLLFLLGILEYGRYFMTMHLLNNATEEACRYAVSHTQPIVLGGVTYGNATSDVTNAFTACMAGQQLSSQSVQVYLSDSLGNNTGTWTNAQAGEFVTVQVTGTYNVLMASLLRLPATISVSVKAVMRVEGS